MISQAYQVLFAALNSFYPLSEPLKKALIAGTEELEMPKGTILFDIGDKASTAFFIVEGMARTFYYKDEKEVTNNLCPENRIFISASSFYTGEPSYEIGEIIEDSKLILLSHDMIEKLCTDFLELNFIIRRLTEIYYVVLDQRSYFLHMKNVQEKYDFLMQNNPDFFQRVPLGQIASFLGMTPETLSRLRSKK